MTVAEREGVRLVVGAHRIVRNARAHTSSGPLAAGLRARLSGKWQAIAHSPSRPASKKDGLDRREH